MGTQEQAFAREARRDIELEVRCMGCGDIIPTPADADWKLFRVGYRVHVGRERCLSLLEQKLNRGQVLR